MKISFQEEPQRRHLLRPAAGEPHGYFDGWRDDGCVHYTGEGQYGDQQMKSGNAAILNHEEKVAPQVPLVLGT